MSDGVLALESGWGDDERVRGMSRAPVGLEAIAPA